MTSSCLKDQLYGAKHFFTLLHVGVLTLLSYCCAGNPPKPNHPSIRPGGPDVGAVESGHQGRCSWARFLCLCKRTGDILVTPERSPWKLQDGGCKGSTPVYLWCYVCCYWNQKYLKVENRDVSGLKPTPTSVILTLGQLNILTYARFPSMCR